MGPDYYGPPKQKYDHDDGVITLARFPKTLPVCSHKKTGCKNKRKKNISMEEKTKKKASTAYVWNGAHGSIIQVRTGNGYHV